jgi:ABC-type polysaccharide/polyol phosphate transport system ATPase subunit
MCTRIVELDHGEIKRIGSYAEIVGGHKHEA